MDTKTMTLEVADDGTLTIPVDLTCMLRLTPRQTVTVEAREDTLVLMPSLRRRFRRSATEPASVQARKDPLTRIGNLLRAALTGIEWLEIEKGRRNRWF